MKEHVSGGMPGLSTAQKNRGVPKPCDSLARNRLSPQASRTDVLAVPNQVFVERLSFPGPQQQSEAASADLP